MYYPGLPFKLTMKRETTVNVLEDNMRKIDETIIELIP